ncbi:MAG: DUF2806 domain-containing protein [Alphaproteobacteria bacterium]
MARGPDPTARARLRRFDAAVAGPFGLTGDDGRPAAAEARAGLRTARAEARRQRNLEAILSIARADLEGKVVEEPVDPGWIDRFIAAAADAHAPQPRSVFAHLLATETMRPGSVSARTLVRLAGMSAADLTRFEKIARFLINNFVVRLKDSFFEGHGIDGEDLFYFEESGLIRSGGSNVKHFPTQVDTQFQTHLLYGDRVLRVTASDPSKRLVIPCYRLTTPGAEIAEAMRLPVANDYITQIVDLLERRGYSVSHASILERGDRNTVTRHSRFSEIVSYDRARASRRRRPR